MARQANHRLASQSSKHREQTTGKSRRIKSKCCLGTETRPRRQTLNEEPYWTSLLALPYAWLCLCLWVYVCLCLRASCRGGSERIGSDRLWCMGNMLCFMLCFALLCFALLCFALLCSLLCNNARFIDSFIHSFIYLFHFLTAKEHQHSTK